MTVVLKENPNVSALLFSQAMVLTYSAICFLKITLLVRLKDLQISILRIQLRYALKKTIAQYVVE